MATGSSKDITCQLLNVGTLTLEPSLKPWGIFVSGDMLIVTDDKADKVHVYRLRDGMLLSISDQLEAGPRGICYVNDNEICVALSNGTIEIMSIENTGVITMIRKLHLKPAFNRCYGVARFIDKVVLCGVKKDTICWCIVSLQDGQAETVHEICNGWYCHLSTKENMIYVACNSGHKAPDHGVYGYNIRNPTQQPFIYKHRELNFPSGVTVDGNGFLFICSWIPPCIHHVTDKCQLLNIYREGIPRRPNAILWDRGILYVTSWETNVITRYKPEYSHHQGPVIPMEILRMDDRSIQLYKKALQDGKEKVYNIRVMVVGQYAVGKTTLIKRLLGQKVNICETKSTEGIDIHKHCCKISLDNKEWIVEPEDSDQLDRLHRLVKLLTNERERSEVTDEQEGHREEISPNHPDSDDEDTPIIYHNVFSDNDDDTPTSLDIHQERDATALALEVSSITSKGDAMTEFLQLVNEKAEKLMKSKAEYASLSMWDFAGQYIFYTTHQTFLTHRAIYLLVTDLSQQVTDLVKGDEFYFDTRGVSLCQVQDLVEVWLNSIHSCESSRATNTPVISHDASIVVTPLAASITDTSPHAGTTLTVTATSIAATSTSASTNISADMRFTPPRASIAAISSSALNIVTFLATGITATSAPADTTSTASSAGNKVISSAAGTTMTSHAAGIIVTSSAANITVTSSSAGSTGIYSAGYTALASPGANTPLKVPVHGISYTPPVILVGTHMDKIREDKRQEVSEMYFSQICRFFNDKPAFRNVVRFVPIDNTQVDPQLETLKDLILQMASKQPYWGEEVPSSWLPMEEALMKLKASGQKVIPRSLIEELNATSSIQIKDAEQLDLFLKMQHEIGAILYFSIDGLKEKIILDPQWLIDALKSLITAEMFILVKYPGIRSKWFELKDNGKLTYELIDAVWSKDKNPEFYESKEHLLLVMEQLNVIAKPKIYIEERDELKIKTGNYFLVPCMLRQNTPEEVVCPKLNDQIGSSPVMCYVFVDKVLPSPIFHRILAACVAHWPIATKKKEEMQENLIFCGCCVFQLDQYHKLTLYFREYVIFVRVTRMGIKDKTPSSKLCIEVRKFITTNLRKIIGYLAQSLKFEYFVQCPEYNGVSINSLIPVSLLKENAEVRCDFHDHIIESCKVLNFWFEDQIQSRNADICRNRNLEVQDETKVSQAGNLKAEVDQTESVFVHRQLAQLAMSVGIIRTPDSNGTGFRVGPDYIMTARHVIEPIVKKDSVFQQHQMPHIRQLDSAIVYIDFSYERNGVPTDPNLVFFFEPEIVYENDYLDTVILKLKHDSRPYPPPFTNFFDVSESPPDRGPGYFIGHSRSDIKRTDRYQFVKLEPRDIISIKNWSMEIANEDGYGGIDNEHRILFHCSFEKGASGAPGFWIDPADGQARLELMLLCGYPTWFYDKFQGQMSGIPKSCLFEQGVSLKLIYDALKAENESLCNEIFEMRR